MRRLPAGFTAPVVQEASSQVVDAEERRRALYQREAGGAESRLFGVAVHALLEQASSLLQSDTPWESISNRLLQQVPSLVARARAAGLQLVEAVSMVQEAIKTMSGTLETPITRWLLDKHPGGASETSWIALFGNQPRSQP